jgi:hypothetical protein
MSTHGSRYVGGVALAVSAMALLWLLLPSPSIAVPPAASTDTSDFVQQLAVPAYAHPVADRASWSQLSASGPGSVGIIVANVANGPGGQPEPAWTEVIHDALTSGGRVLGYVDTGYLGAPSLAHPNGLPTRSGQLGPRAWLSQIHTDIDAWYQFYGPDLGGIFFDQGTSACGPAAGSDQYADEYRTLRGQLSAAHPAALTVLNPGTPVPPCYRDAADVLVTFEGSYANYTGTSDGQSRHFQPLRWAPHAPSQIWHIVYGATSSDQMERAMALSRERRAGYIYVTDAGLPNPFATLPPVDYWTAEQAQRAR